MNQHRPLLLLAIIFFSFSLSYLAVPLFKIFCQTTGYGGTIATHPISISSQPINDFVTVHFDSSVAPDLPLLFVPQTEQLNVRIGESALAFFIVTNLSNVEVTGMSTFNVTPHQVGQYFVKIQCFCFEEQRWAPNESVEMPVLFFIDPLIRLDPSTSNVTDLVLSYTLFNST